MAKWAAKWATLAACTGSLLLACAAIAASAQRDAPDSRLDIGGQAAETAATPRVMLYEEDADAIGKAFPGTVTWRIDRDAPAGTRKSETILRADIAIPERRLALSWSLRRNDDKSLPATHLIEMIFRLEPGFAHGGIENVPGLLMKSAEQARGEPVSGASVKVTSDYFLIGLSTREKDVERNLTLLRERAWIDVPVIFTDSHRAILAFEKGDAGSGAFAAALAAWKD